MAWDQGTRGGVETPARARATAPLPPGVAREKLAKLAETMPTIDVARLRADLDGVDPRVAKVRAGLRRLVGNMPRVVRHRRG
jgi:hypothetical protein